MILSSVNFTFVYQKNEEHAVARLVESLHYKIRMVAGRNFLINIILPAALCAWSRLRLLTEMSTRNIFWGVNPVGA